MNSVANKRITRELQMLARGAAAPGIAAWARDDGSRLDVLHAEINGAPDTPYEHGVFRLELNIPREYPFKPPRVRFLTKIYHPNVDSDGRICLDSLNMPPKGAWKPSLNVATVLTSIQALMSTPNADDGLMVDITHEYRTNPAVFQRKAKQWTRLYAQPPHVAHCDASEPSHPVESHTEPAPTPAPDPEQVQKPEQKPEQKQKQKQKPHAAEPHLKKARTR